MRRPVRSVYKIDIDRRVRDLRPFSPFFRRGKRGGGESLYLQFLHYLCLVTSLAEETDKGKKEGRREIKTKRERLMGR